MKDLNKILMTISIIFIATACSSASEPIATQYKNGKVGNGQAQGADREAVGEDAVSENDDNSTPIAANSTDEEKEVAAEEEAAEEAPEEEPSPEELAAAEAEKAEQARIASVGLGKAIYENAANNCMGCHGAPNAPTAIVVANLNLQLVVAAAAKPPHANTMAIFQNQTMAQNILDFLQDAAGLVEAAASE